MKAKKNLTYRLVQTLSNEEVGSFLNFVNWYKSEILEFTKTILENNITNDQELNKYKSHTAGTLRVYKNKLKDTVLEYLSIVGKNDNLEYLKKLSHIRTLNLLGDEFLGNARVETNKVLKTIKPYTKLMYEVILYSEITMSAKGFSDDVVHAVTTASNQAISKTKDVLNVLESYSFYVQSSALIQRDVILRSKESMEAYSKLCDHPARFIKYSEIKESPIKYFWLSGSLNIEFFSDDLDMYLEYAKKIYEISISMLDLFNESSNLALFLAELELTNALLSSWKLDKALESLRKMKTILPKIPKSEVTHMIAELYEKEIALATLGVQIKVNDEELLKLIRTEKDLITTNSVRVYRFVLLKYYLTFGKLSKASDMANAIINEKGADKLSISELELSKFIQVCIQFSHLVQKTKTRKFNPEDYISFKSLLKSYKEKIRKLKTDFALELIFVEAFSQVQLDFSISDYQTLTDELISKLAQLEREKKIKYHLRFKRLFNYNMWLERLLDLN